ncbi:MAG: RNA methyltransferase [Candidatus Accumulibacter sp.]|jgi:TrmH family RNA methyltransferase|nr:RNA methyltransferase [Accumulibacter sp.]
MFRTKRISSRDNADFRELKKLCASVHARRRSGRVILDGMHLIESYTRRFGSPEAIVVSETGQGHAEIARYLEDRPEIAALILADALFTELATVDASAGILAVVGLPHGVKDPDPSADAVLLDGVQDPGNLGSILRTAAAAGFGQVLLSTDCARAWSPKTLRAGMGAHFSLDIHENRDLPEFLAGCRGRSIATAPDAALELYALDPADLVRPVAWVFGSEGQGVRPEVSVAASLRVRIPMPGRVESLNVGAAAAVCLFETARRRAGGIALATPGASC